MKYIDHYDKVLEKYNEAWHLENHDRPVMNVTSWEQKTPVLKEPDSVEARWLNTDFVARKARYIVENQHYSGESFPTVFTNLGPDLFAALYGAELKFGESTSWSEHCISEWKEGMRLTPDRNGKWYKKIIELTEAMVEESKGDYVVGITDIHPGMDALVAMRGPQELCMDLYDCPELIKPLPMQLFEGFKQLYDDLYRIVTRYTKGTTTWMKILSDDKSYVTSCDLICMISQDNFDEFVREELIAETKWLDKNIFHLDGPGALRHLDALLEIPTINGIQWVPGAGAPPAGDWPEVLQKVQRAGKMLQLHVDNANELKTLSEVVKPEGVIIDCYAANAEQADELVRYAEKLWKK